MGNFHLIFLSCVLLGCSRDKTTNHDRASEAGVHSDLSTFDSGFAAVPSTIYLVVTGGPNAGTYQAEVGHGGCTSGSNGPNSWVHQYTLSASDPRTFSSLQIIAPDVAKGADGTVNFLLSASFGPIHSAREYRVETRTDASAKSGSGKITVDDQGERAQIRFAAVTAQGVKLEGRIDCRSIIRP